MKSVDRGTGPEVLILKPEKKQDSQNLLSSLYADGVTTQLHSQVASKSPTLDLENASPMKEKVSMAPIYSDYRWPSNLTASNKTNDRRVLPFRRVLMPDADHVDTMRDQRQRVSV